MTRDIRHMAVLGFAILAVLLFGTFNDGIDRLSHRLAESLFGNGGPSGAALAGTPGAALAGTATVIDGDTLDLHGQRIRLHGIDAPESGQSCQDADGAAYRCGQRAALALADRIGRRPVTCAPRDTDRYGRAIAVCMADGEDLNAWMVAQGHALAYRRYSSDYVDEEALARRDRRGLWAGAFVAPWDWRRGVRGPGDTGMADTAPSPDCPIKGNISRSGARIYHMPGQEHYARTRISAGKGERWFCSEAEARAAGWRRAR